MSTFNEAQYREFLIKSEDVYARSKYEILLRWLRAKGPSRILNAGCGSGELSMLMALDGHEVVGIDPAPEYIDLANSRASGFPGAKFLVSSIEDYDGPGEFDAVVSTDVIEHIEDDRAAFNKLADLTRVGGQVLLTVPAGQWLFGYHDEQLGHYRRYSASSLSRLVSERCSVHKLRYFGCSLIPICLLFSKWMRKPYPLAKVGGSKQSLVSRLLRAMLATERRVPLPLGTTVLISAEKRAGAEQTHSLRKAA